MSSALNPWGFCASSLTPFDCRYSRIVPETAGVRVGGIGATGVATADPEAPGAVAGVDGTKGFDAGGVARNLLLGTCPGTAVTFCGAGAGTTGAGDGAGTN